MFSLSAVIVRVFCQDNPIVFPAGCKSPHGTSADGPPLSNLARTPPPGVCLGYFFESLFYLVPFSSPLLITRIEISLKFPYLPSFSLRVPNQQQRINNLFKLQTQIKSISQTLTRSQVTNQKVQTLVMHSIDMAGTDKQSTLFSIRPRREGLREASNSTIHTLYRNLF